MMMNFLVKDIRKCAFIKSWQNEDCDIEKYTGKFINTVNQTQHKKANNIILSYILRMHASIL